MNSEHSNQLPPPTVTTLPPEILLLILDVAFELPSPRPILGLLLLSKPICNFLLSGVYHTVNILPSEVTRKSRPTDETLLCSAPLSSRALVRRMECSHNLKHLSFKLFPNVTHLRIWGSGREDRWRPHCAPVALLPLEELLMWSRENLNTLSYYISEDSPICHTLCKLTYHDGSLSLPGEKWLKCQRLTHILVFTPTFYNLSDFLGTIFPTFPKLECYLAAPIRDLNFSLNPESPEASFSGDRRVALVWEQFDISNVLTWSSQSSMWRKVDQYITQNPNPKAVTLIDEL
ncbi:hypothetical protein DL96DRAFT_1580939 [Flagelloscypha sp. PMI_526]|nr:hypothetical protein DL96DRAFT_1580939 [Flagelloscypha sp. PMI_526]